MATANGTAESSNMLNENDGYTVELYIYDISTQIKQSLSSNPFDLDPIKLWHTGLVAYGREYFFGASGIQSCTPGSTVLGEPSRVNEIGESEVPYQLFLEYIFGLAETSYKPGTYNFPNKNSNTFTEEVAQFLCGRGIPKEISILSEEFSNGKVIEVLEPIFKNFEIRKFDTKNIDFGGASTSIQGYVPHAIKREDDKEFEELNSAIEEVRHRSLILEDRRNSLNEKLLKRERKEKKKKKKKNKENGEEEKSEKKKKRHSKVTFNFSETQIEGGSLRRHSEPTISPTAVYKELPSLEISKTSGKQNGHLEESITNMSDNVETESQQEPCAQLETNDQLQEVQQVTEPIPAEEHSTRTINPEPGTLGEPEPEVEREPPIIYKDCTDTRGEFEGFVSSCAELLSGEEQRHMEELRAYVIEDEGSWALGENFNGLFARVFNDPVIPDDARLYLLRIMAAAALKDDVILMLHQDRKEHTIMNFANKIESFVPSVQEALALFFCNMFEHLCPSEWLLYISEWQECGQQISNIRVTTKVAVNALLHQNPKVQEYGTAIMYNLGTKEVKTVVFDDVAPELAMAILQFFNGSPTEEYVWRTLTALTRFCFASNEVPQLIKMIGPEPSAFKGMSDRIDMVIEDISSRLNRIRTF